MIRRRRGRPLALVVTLLAGTFLVGPPEDLPHAPWRWAASFPGREPAVVLAAACWFLCIVAGSASLGLLLAHRRVCDQAPEACTRVRVEACRRWVGELVHRARSPTVGSLLAPIGLWAAAGPMPNDVAGAGGWDAAPPQSTPSIGVAASRDSQDGPPVDGDAIALIRLNFDLAPLPSSPIESLEVDESWTVETGDNLWAIAAATLEDRWHRSAGDGEIDVYWRRLIATNRSVLVDAANPDLILPGQVLLLPPTSG